MAETHGNGPGKKRKIRRDVSTTTEKEGENLFCWAGKEGTRLRRENRKPSGVEFVSLDTSRPGKEAVNAQAKKGGYPIQARRKEGNKQEIQNDGRQSHFRREKSIQQGREEQFMTTHKRRRGSVEAYFHQLNAMLSWTRNDRSRGKEGKSLYPITRKKESQRVQRPKKKAWPLSASPRKHFGNKLERR